MPTYALVSSLPEMYMDYLSVQPEVLAQANGVPIEDLIVVGPVSSEQENAGVISIMDAGAGAPENYTPVMRGRLQVTCAAPTLEHAERLNRAVFTATHGAARHVVTLTSSGKKYLIHSLLVTGGPSTRAEGDNTVWRGVQFVGIFAGMGEVP